MVKLKAPEEVLRSYKKANKTRKASILNNAGCDSEEEYIQRLEAKIAKGSTPAPVTAPAPVSNTTVPKKKKKKRGRPRKQPVQAPAAEKPTVHHVHILDKSASMGSWTSVRFKDGDKFYNAIKGINSEIEKLSQDINTDNLFTLVSFAAPRDYSVELHRLPVKAVAPRIHTTYTPGNSTALTDAIGKTLTTLMAFKNLNENVLVSIFTDGDENSSTQYKTSQIAPMIKKAEAMGITITFIADKKDIDRMARYYGIHESNTLGHDNTAAGVEAAFATKREATALYSSNLAAGNDVSRGFYKRVI